MTGARGAYDTWHDRYAVDADADAPWHVMMKQYVAPAIADAHVLEIGCGRGGFACWLATVSPAPRAVLAADFSPTAVAKGATHARRLGVERARWVVADIEQLACPNATFDAVVSCETVEHVPHPARAVAEMARVLKPGGRLYLTTPNYFGTMGLYRAYLRLRGRPYTEEGQPINNLTWLPRTRRWVRRAGLRIVHMDGIGHYLPFPGRPPIRLTALDGIRYLTRWFALHSLVVAERPAEGQ